jgi:hypothetical protein
MPSDDLQVEAELLVVLPEGERAWTITLPDLEAASDLQRDLERLGITLRVANMFELMDRRVAEAEPDDSGTGSGVWALTGGAPRT